MGELNYAKIGKRIKGKRTALHITQEKLAEEIDVSPSYISEIERGTSISSLAVIAKIANILDLNLDYLVFGINSKNIDETFSEIIKSIPEKEHKLYIDICQNISKSFTKRF